MSYSLIDPANDNAASSGGVVVSPPTITSAPARVFAAELLERRLPNGWIVTAEVPRRPSATGAVHSKSYVVEGPDRSRAFLKALDFAAALQTPHRVNVMEAMLRAYRHEVDLVRQCADRKMDRVVRVLDHGEVVVEEGNPYSMVPYLIFEIADGDVYDHVDFAAGIDIAWTMRTLHNVAVGLAQLHHQQIAHQDVKPSNVVVFRATGCKIGDLGRATARDRTADHDDLMPAGDRKYSPPELLYGCAPNDWNDRRFGCDLYMFGALAIFLLTGLCIAPELQRLLPRPFRLGYAGPYADLLPFLRKATNELILRVEGVLAPELRSSMGSMIRSLCEPDPERRGHPGERVGRNTNRHDLRRYISELDIAARRADALVRRYKIV